MKMLLLLLTTCFAFGFNFNSTELIPIMPNFNGVIVAPDSSVLFYGNNGVFHRYKNMNTSVSYLNIDDDIVAIKNYNDSLIGLTSQGYLLISNNNGYNWKKSKFEYNFKEKLREVIVSDKFYLLFSDTCLTVFDKNLEYIADFNYDFFSVKNQKYLIKDNKLYYHLYTNDKFRLKYLDLTNNETILSGFQNYCTFCRYTRSNGLDFINNRNSLTYIVNNSNILQMDSINEFVRFTNKDYIDKSYYYDKNYYIINTYNMLENYRFFKFFKVDENFILKKQINSDTVVHSHLIGDFRDIYTATSGSEFYFTGYSGLKGLINEENGIQYLSSSSGHIYNTVFNKNSLLIGTNKLFTVKSNDLIDFTAPIQKSLNIKNLPPSIKEVFFTQDIDNYSKSKFNYFGFASVTGNVNYFYSIDSNKSYQQYKSDTLIYSTDNNIYYLGTKENKEYITYISPIFLNSTVLVKFELGKAIEVIKTFDNLVINARMNKDEAFYYSRSKKNQNQKLLYKYNISNSSIDTLFNLNISEKYSSCYFIGSTLDTALIIAYDTFDIAKARYRILVCDLKTKTINTLESSSSNAYPKNFFYLKDGTAMIVGDNYVLDYTNNKKQVFSSNLKFKPKVNINYVLQTITISGDSISSCEFIQNLDSTTSIESPQIEESAYLYTYPPRPNPATQSVSAEVYWNSAYTLSESNILVYDIYGSKYNSNITFTSKEPFRAIINADCSNLATGIYFIRISVNGEHKIIPFTVVK